MKRPPHDIVATIVLSAALLLMAATSCAKGKSTAKGDHALPDSIVVGTLYSPTGFFIVKNDTLGYDYDRICDFAKDKGIGIKFVIGKNLSDLIEMLNRHQIDIIAHEVPETAEFKQSVLNCGLADTTYQVLVQPQGTAAVGNVTSLVGKDVYVEAKSRYEARLRNLDNEVGGGIKIHTVDNDTVMTEDLIEMVAEGKLPMTIADSDLAQFYKTYYGNLDISLKVGFPQRSSWAVNKSDKWLADSIDKWSNSTTGLQLSKSIKRRYFELSKKVASADSAKTTTTHTKGLISAYDHLFKQYSENGKWDWRLLAAIGMTESRFQTNAVSWSGAVGIMQVMPSIGRSHGVKSRSELAQPATNVKVAVMCLNDINQYIKTLVRNQAERQHFILASYNAGIGHVCDAIALARKYGKDPGVWYGNVEEAILWKANPEYYNDPVCKYGYFRGRQTVAYVKEVERHYNHYKNKVK